MAKKKRGSHFKKKAQTDPVLAYFERYTRKQLVAMLLMADAAVGIRNVVLAQEYVKQVLTDEDREKLASLPYSELVAPQAVDMEPAGEPTVVVSAGDFSGLTAVEDS